MRCENGHYQFYAPREGKRGAACPTCGKPMSRVQRETKRPYRRKGAEAR